MFAYWSKVEYEMVLTDVFTSIDNNELERLKQLYDRYNYSTNLKVEKKIDIYDQVMLNWDIFSEYVYKNI